MPNHHTTDVIIAGGGMVGMTMGLLLAKSGIHATIVERTPFEEQLNPNFDGRTCALSAGSIDILKTAGAWGAMLPHAEPMLDIRVSDGNSRLFVHYDHKDIGDEPFGYIVENRVIRHALYSEIKKYCSPLRGEQLSKEQSDVAKRGGAFSKTQIHPHASSAASGHDSAAPPQGGSCKIFTPHTITAFHATPHKVTATLDNGDTIRANLLIAADGRSSHIRKQAGINTTTSDYNQTAIVCTIKHEKPHHGVAVERFLPAGPFAILPMQHNRSSLVWTEHREFAPEFIKLTDKELADEILTRMGDYLGNIEVIGPRFTYPLTFLLANRYTDERLALIGDAAHGMHPIAGQGINLGFRDVKAIADILAKRQKLGLDLGAPDVLAEYETLRQFDVTTMLAITDGLTRLFSNNILPLKIARRAGLGIVNQFPPLKKIFMKHAMGRL